MAQERMDDFAVAIDPRTGELRPARPGRAFRASRPAAGSRWRGIAIGVAVLVVPLLGVFAIALLSELV